MSEWFMSCFIDRILEDTLRRCESSAEVKSIVEECLKLLVEEREKNLHGRKGYGVVLPGEARFVVVGDIHGDLDTLTRILRKNVRDGVPDDTYLVFLGDYVDRGEYQVECMLLVLRLKLEAPERVVVLRGNHEPPPSLLPYPHDFPYVLRSRYGVDGVELYQLFKLIFNELPHVALAEGSLLFLHGGPPAERRGDSFEELFAVETQDLDVLEDVLWSDPADWLEEWSDSPRGAGKLYGIKVTERALKISNAKAIVRGHEPCSQGYKFNHGGKVLTLFSRVGPPYMNRVAAYLDIKTSGSEWKKNPLAALRKSVATIGG